MASLIHIVIVTVLLATAVLGQKNDANLKVTNGTQDYVKIAQAELLVKIKISELENDAIDTRFLDRLAVIEQHQQQILDTTQQVNETLIPLQALSLPRKYCIQTYDSQFITHDNAKEQLQTCIIKAGNSGYSLTSTARSATKAARNYATNTLPYNLRSNCAPASYSYNQTRIDQCYIKYVNLANQSVQDNLERAQSLREQSLYDMNIITLTAVQCSFKIEKVVIEKIAFTSKKIDDCIDQLQKKTAIMGVGDKKALY